MSIFDSLTVGSLVTGIRGEEPVTIVALKWHGHDVVDVTYKDSTGEPHTQLLYRDDSNDLHIISANLPWSFTAAAAKVKLASEAYRINLAHLFDPYLAVHTSAVEPLPHQISAVYQEMLPRLPLRYILADDPGAGKTIMTGLYIKELIARGDLKRCLIVAPGSLVEQWQDELFDKFHLSFDILTNDRLESARSGNAFAEKDLCICRLDKLARDEELQAKLKATDWDLIVCDEAHKMSATVWGNEVKYTKRFNLGRLLSNLTRHFLLLTATPHNGKENDFHLFLSLIDADRFEGMRHKTTQQAVDVGDIMRRLVKEELLTFEGKPLFPERRAYTVNYELSDPEAELYNDVSEYVRGEFNRADNLNKERKNTVGFALTVLQRRLASSPEAIYQSLHRRCKRLEQRLAEERLGRRAEEYRLSNFDDIDEDDFSAAEQEDWQDQVMDRASAAATVAELEAEIATLKRLEHQASKIRTSGVDRKWDELSHLLQDNDIMFSAEGEWEKLIIFTEHKDTLNYLADKIRSLMGRDDAVVTIHGSMGRDERHKMEELFKQDVGVRIMIATDAAGEGINLQRAHLMINYDLPWNPNRLEQRFGRIHRIGQTEVCHLWNMVAEGTREGDVFQRLFTKLEEERQALGGKVFDILGAMTFDNKPLRELLIEAIRYGNDPQVKARLNKVVDSTLNRESFQQLIDERALTEDVMDVSQVMAIREDMERREAHKLQPHYIAAFFLEAFRDLGGVLRSVKQEPGRYRIDHVPLKVLNRDTVRGWGKSVLKRYERVCFDKAHCHLPGQAQAELLCPGHPLLEAVISLVREQNADALKQGTIFVDEDDFSSEARLLVYVEDAVQDGVRNRDGKMRTISKHIHFVELKEDGRTASAGYAPYLDYRPLEEAERPAVVAWLQEQNWLKCGVAERAESYAIVNLVRPHLQEVKEQRLALIDKTEKAVKERLTQEIQYWDAQTAELREKEEAGQSNDKLNSVNAARRADELAARLQKRLAELKSERQLASLPPLVTGGALVIPKGLLARLQGESVPALNGMQNRQAIELAAMNAVMEIERRLGYEPRDVSGEKCGYDVESRVPDSRRAEREAPLRFIEVKGRTAGATTVTVTKNEILTALNKPEEYILALVEVDGEATHTVYLKHPFAQDPDSAATSVNYDMKELIANAEVLWRDAD